MGSWLRVHARDPQDGGHRAAQHPLRGGRPHPPPLLDRARADRRDRQGGEAAAVALRRAARALLPPRPGAARGPRRPRDRDLGGEPRRLPALRSSGPALAAAARGCDAGPAPARRGRPQRPRLQPAAAATSRCSTAPPGARPAPETALAFRLKLALAAGFSPELASCARCGEAEHLSGILRRRRRGGVRRLRAGVFELGPEAHRFMVDALGKPLPRRPRPRRGPCARRSGRSPRRSSTMPTCGCGPLPEAPGENRIAAEGAAPCQ